MSGFGYPVDSKNDCFFPIKFSFYIYGTVNTNHIEFHFDLDFFNLN